MTAKAQAGKVESSRPLARMDRKPGLGSGHMTPGPTVSCSLVLEPLLRASPRSRQGPGQLDRQEADYAWEPKPGLS